MELMYIVGIVIALALLVRGGLWLRDYQRRLRIRLEPAPPGPEPVERFPELSKVRVRPRFSDDDLPEGDDEPAPGPVIVVSSRDRDRDRDGDRSSRVTPVSAGALRAAGVSERSATAPAAPAAAAAAPASVPASASALASAPVDPASASVPASFSASVPAPLPRLAADPLAAAVNAASIPVAVAAGASSHPATAGPADPSVSSATGEEVPVLLTPVAAAALLATEQQDMFADQMIAPPPMPGRPRSRVEALYGTPAVEPVRPVRIPDSKPHVDIQDVIALHVVARHHPFNGEELLRCILSYGLRFGEMSIFHRHERPTGQGRVLFSMAKAVEPGIFDLQAMSGEEIPGVSFFMSLPGVNSIHAYDILVDTAKRLATDLQGEILDEQRQPLTRQLVEHYRERVQEFERRRLMQRPVH